jgi:hypothetical protein
MTLGGLERAPFAGLEAGMPSTPSIGPADVVIPGLLRGESLDRGSLFCQRVLRGSCCKMAVTLIDLPDQFSKRVIA